MDNIAIIGPDNDYISEIISKLSKRFAITDLRLITSYLKVEIKRTTNYNTTILSQKDYIIKVLKKFKIDKSNSVSTLIDIRFIR